MRCGGCGDTSSMDSPSHDANCCSRCRWSDSLRAPPRIATAHAAPLRGRPCSPISIRRIIGASNEPASGSPPASSPRSTPSGDSTSGSMPDSTRRHLVVTPSSTRCPRRSSRRWRAPRRRCRRTRPPATPTRSCACTRSPVGSHSPARLLPISSASVSSTHSPTWCTSARASGRSCSTWSTTTVCCATTRSVGSRTFSSPRRVTRRCSHSSTTARVVPMGVVRRTRILPVS